MGYMGQRTPWFRTLLLGSLLALGSPTVSFSDDPMLISKVLEDLDEYHLAIVTLRGTVSDVNALAPYYIAEGTGCYGAYTFTLTDDSGALPIAVLGFCGTPVYRLPPIADGDRVLVEAHIQAPGLKGSPGPRQMGMPTLRGVPPNIFAVANLIERATVD